MRRYEMLVRDIQDALVTNEYLRTLSHSALGSITPADIPDIEERARFNYMNDPRFNAQVQSDVAAVVRVLRKHDVDGFLSTGQPGEGER